MMDDTALALEIAATRARIASTAEALLYRADVKSRIGETVADRLASARAAARDRLAGMSAGWNGNGHAAVSDIAWVPAEDVTILPLDDAALDEGVLGEVSIVEAVIDARAIDAAPDVDDARPRRMTSRNVALVVFAAIATALIAWFVLAMPLGEELQDRDSA